MAIDLLLLWVSIPCVIKLPGGIDAPALFITPVLV